MSAGLTAPARGGARVLTVAATMVAATLAAVASTPAWSQQDSTMSDSDLLAFGEHLVHDCAGCHRIKREDTHMSKLLGRSKDDLYNTLNAMRRRAEGAGIMTIVFRELTETDMRAIAAYLAKEFPSDQPAQAVPGTGAAPVKAEAEDVGDPSRRAAIESIAEMMAANAVKSPEGDEPGRAPAAVVAKRDAAQPGEAQPDKARRDEPRDVMASGGFAVTGLAALLDEPAPPSGDPAAGRPADEDAQAESGGEPGKIEAASAAPSRADPEIEAKKPPDLPIETIREAQQHLNSAGFTLGVADGVWGPRSQTALESYLEARGLPVEDGLTGEALKRLRAEPTVVVEIPADAAAGRPPEDPTAAAEPAKDPVAALEAPTSEAGEAFASTDELVVGSIGVEVPPVEVAPLEAGAETAVASTDPGRAPSGADPGVVAALAAEDDRRGQIQGDWSGLCKPREGGVGYDMRLTVDGAGFEGAMRLPTSDDGRAQFFRVEGLISSDLDIQGASTCRGKESFCREIAGEGGLGGVFPALEVGERFLCALER